MTSTLLMLSFHCFHSVHFVYRPKVQSMKEHETGKQAAASFDDIQRMHMILLPRASDHTHDESVAFRMVTLGNKRLPHPEAALAAGQEPGVSIRPDATVSMQRWECRN